MASALKEALMYQSITGSVRADNSTLKVSVIDHTRSDGCKR